jgi:hypothetical protein
MSDSGHELRLREPARRTVAAYRSGEISLRQLVDDLDVIWSELAPSQWRDEFRGHWWTLEQVYAVALDRGELNALPDDAVSDIEEAASGLEELLK